MSKSLTLSMSLALALGFSGVSFAGHGCDNCGLTSPQGIVSPQSSPQGYVETCDSCAPKKHGFKFSIPSCLKPKPKTYCYEWVLKKKRVWGHHEAVCDTCGPTVTPSGQHYGSPQGTWPAPQAGMIPTMDTKPPVTGTAPMGDMVPSAPKIPVNDLPPADPKPATSASGSLLFLAPTGN